MTISLTDPFTVIVMTMVASLLGGSSGLSYSVLRSQPCRWSSIRDCSQARAMQSASTCRIGMPFMSAFVLSVGEPARTFGARELWPPR
jgi:hypothetical protein